MDRDIQVELASAVPEPEDKSIRSALGFSFSIVAFIKQVVMEAGIDYLRQNGDAIVSLARNYFDQFAAKVDIPLIEGEAEANLEDQIGDALESTLRTIIGAVTG